MKIEMDENTMRVVGLIAFYLFLLGIVYIGLSKM